jgi:thiol-disulfide isomerase/thioredoxin
VCFDNKEQIFMFGISNIRNRSTWFTSVFILAVSHAFLASCSNGTWESVKLEVAEGYQSAAAYYMPSRSPAAVEPAEDLVSEPDYRGTPYYGTYTIGNGSDNVFTYVIDQFEDNGSLFYLDLNNNENLADDGNGEWDRLSARTNMVQKTLMVPYELNGEVEEVPLQFFFYFFNGENPTTRGVLYARDFARVGEVTLAGQTYKIGITENDNDGIFNMRETGVDTLNPRFISLTIDLDQDGELLTSSDSPEHFNLGEPFNAGGKSYTIADVSPMGDLITFRRSEEEVEPKVYIAVGYKAPEFSQADCRGNEISLEAFLKEHKVVLLDFWATWCGPCIAELPNVIAVYEEYNERGLGILGISLDLAPDPDEPQEGQKSREQVREFMDENGMPWPSTYDGLYWQNAVSNQYRINSIPATLLLDGDGVIRYMNVRGDALKSAVKELIEEAERN